MLTLFKVVQLFFGQPLFLLFIINNNHQFF